MIFRVCQNAMIVCFSQVKIDKFMTPEQWKKVEENRRIEEEKRLREKGDNWRERGLDQMMGGVLEVKREDELKKVRFLRSVGVTHMVSLFTGFLLQLSELCQLPSSAQVNF